MRKAKIWILSAVAILSLISIRDKEIVLHVPAGKPLMAEAYRSPDSEIPLAVSGTPQGAATTQISAQLPGNNTNTYDSDNNTTGTYPSAQGMPSQPGGTVPYIPASVMTNSVQGLGSPGYYGAGNVFDTGATNANSNTNNTPIPQTSPSTPVFVTGITPASGISGTSGTSVIIQGAGFSTTAADNIVQFGTVQANSVTVVSANQLRVTVPHGLSAGFTDVTVSVAGSQSKAAAFDVLRDSSHEVFINNTANLLSINLTDSSIIRLADVNGDKRLDLFIVDKAAAKVYLLIQDNTGHFNDETSARITPAVQNASYIVDAAFADVDQDGYPDLLLLYSHPGLDQTPDIRVLHNTGQTNPGHFTDTTATDMLNISTNPVAFDVGDVNGDGFVDIVVAEHEQADYMLLNDGTGKFSKQSNFSAVASPYGSSDIKFCDVNNDGVLDIITTTNESVDSSPLQNHIYINEGSDTFIDATATTPLPGGGKYTEVLDIGDIAHTGAMDIIFADGAQNSVLMNNGQGVFTDRTGDFAPYNGFSSVDTRLGDLTGSGNLDMAVLGASGISLFCNNGTGSFKNDVSIKLPDYVHSPALIGGNNIQLADVNGDGTLDIIVGGPYIPGNNSFYILTSSAVNKAPVLDPIDPKTAEVGKELTFNINASDPNGDPILYSYLLANLPSGPTLDSNSGLFRWTPVAGDIGTYNVTFTAAEDKADNPLSDSKTATIQVTDSTAPVLSVTPDPNVHIYIFLDESVEFLASATGAHKPISITWTVDGNLTGGTPNDFSIFSVAFGSGPHTVVATATDANGVSSFVTWNVDVYNYSRTNHAPVIDGTNLGSEVNISVPHGGTASQTFQVTHSYDPDNLATPPANQTLTFKWYEKDGTTGQYRDITGTGSQQDPTICPLVGLGLGQHYIMVTLTDDGTPPMSTSFVWHVTVSESAPNTYILSINALNGSVAKNPDHTTYNSGDQVTLTATAASGFVFDHWSGDLSGTSNPATITMDSNKTVTANFTAVPVNTYTLGITASNGSVAKNPDHTAYNSGDQVTLTATPAAGFVFDHWSGDLSGTSNPATITMDSNKTVTANFTASVSVTDQIIKSSFNYFWDPTGGTSTGGGMSPLALHVISSTGFIHDRLAVDPANRNSDYDLRYKMASIAATGFGLSAMCVAAENYGDGTNPDWPVSKTDIEARVLTILTALCDIQNNQAPGGDDTWGKAGFFYHYVDIDTGQRWISTEPKFTSEVSTVDTAILVAGVLTAGEYFGKDNSEIGSEIAAKAFQVYSNVNWSAFLDTNPTTANDYVVANPNYNQLYMVWDPSTGFSGHWDYTNEGLLLYMLAAAAPDTSYALPTDTFYSFRRELGNYGANGSGDPMVKTWFGPLFVYQYPQAFFNFKDYTVNPAGGPLYDKQGIDWWQNSVEATRANKRFCNDSLGKFAGQEDLWGLTSGYTDGFTYSTDYNALPADMAVNDPDGTVFPSAVTGSLPILPDECIRAINKMRELYDTYSYKVWGDCGFVSSFRLGASLTDAPSHIASFYCGIDIGATLVMAENNKNKLIWDNFANFMVNGDTMKNRIIGKLGLTTDNICHITLDDISPTANFRMGKLDAVNSEYTIKFDMKDVQGAPYLLAIHSFMDTSLLDHTVTVSVTVNNGEPFDVNFDYHKNGKTADLMKYINIDPQGLNGNTPNTITLKWKSVAGDSNARWLAWQNIAISSPVENKTWAFARDDTQDPKILFGNEYRVGAAYFVGTNVSRFPQAVNKDVRNFTDILFYATAADTDYGALALMVLETQKDQWTQTPLSTNVQIYANGTPVLNTHVVTGDTITTQEFPLVNGWNKITIYHPGVSTDNTAKGEWVRWKSLALVKAAPPVLPTPKNLGAASFGNTTVKLRWEGVDYAAKYNVYRNETSGAPYNTCIATVTDPSYIDNSGLQANRVYYYIVRAAKADNSESKDSNEVSATTGAYRIDYGDGHEPNVFDGSTLDNSGTPIGDGAFTEASKYDGTTGKVRRMVLQPGQKETITLNNSNISDSTIFSFRVEGASGGEKFTIELTDSANTKTSLNFSVAGGGVWQEMHVLLSDFPAMNPAINLASIASINIISAGQSQPITLYFDETEFDTIALGSDHLDVNIRDRATDGLATGLSFGTHGLGTQYVTADQYIDIGYQCSSASWNIIIYTDNKAADAYPKFTGAVDPLHPDAYRANGLIGVQAGNYRVPMVWQVFQAKKYTNPGDLPPWGDFYQTGYIVDKSDADYSKDQYSLPYRAIFRHSSDPLVDLDLGFPLNPARKNYHLKGVMGQRLYVYIGADFEGAPAQAYTTNKLTIDIYHE